MIIGIQIIAIIFAFCMIYFAVLHYKRGELSSVEIFSWIIIWLVTIVVVIFPELLQTFARTFLVTRVFDLMVIGGFILVISLVASSYTRTKRLEKKIEKMIRSDALRQESAGKYKDKKKINE